MHKGFLQMFKDFVSNFGRPDYDLGSDDKIHEADENTKEIRSRREELERRLRLLDIQSTPRGR